MTAHITHASVQIMSRKPARKRLNIEVGPAVEDRLKVIRVRTGASSISEVIRRALAVYDDITANEAEGGTMTVLPKGGESYRLKMTW